MLHSSMVRSSHRQDLLKNISSIGCANFVVVSPERKNDSCLHHSSFSVLIEESHFSSSFPFLDQAGL